MLKMLIAVHLALLALACSCFTLVTGWTSGDWKCNFYSYQYADGWGYVYQSDFTLPTIVTYLAAYAVGLAVFGIAWRGGSRYVAGSGLLLCVAGMVSLAIEGSHCIWSHNFSLIASFPIIVFPLALIAGYRYGRQRRAPSMVADPAG